MTANVSGDPRVGWNCQNCGQKTFRSHYADEMDGLSHWDCPEPVAVDMGTVAHKIVGLERDLAIAHWLIRRMVDTGFTEWSDEARKVIGYAEAVSRGIDLDATKRNAAIEEAEDETMRLAVLLAKKEKEMRVC